MTEVYKTKDGKYLKVEYDEMCDSPRDYDNLFTFRGFCHRYGSPDGQRIANPMEICEEVHVSGPHRFPNSRTHYVYTVSAYDHSAIAFSLSREFCDSIGDAWDSGIFGVMYVDKAKAREWLNIQRFSEKSEQKLFDIASEELQQYEDYCNGNVYRYSLWTQNEDGSYTCEEECANCYGTSWIEREFSEAEELTDFDSDALCE